MKTIYKHKRAIAISTLVVASLSAAVYNHFRGDEEDEEKDSSQK